MKSILSISISPALRVALDDEQRRQRRSRSFLVEEAIRGYLAEQQASAFAEASSQTMCDALELTPEERVLLSEDLWLELASGHTAVKPWTAAFDTFAEYDEWRRNRIPGPS